VEYCERQLGMTNLAAVQPQCLERLRTGYCVDQVSVDEDQRGAVVARLDDVLVPDLFVKGAWFAGHEGQMACVAAQGKQALSMAPSSGGLFGAGGDPGAGDDDRHKGDGHPESRQRDPGDGPADGERHERGDLRLAGDRPALSPVAYLRSPA